MNWAKKILLSLLMVLILIQFIQPARNKSSELSSTDIKKTFSIPENVQLVLQIACYDCHSNNTNYPWYSKIQPFGWLLAKHIKNGKAELNFNEFSSYSLRRQISKLTGIGNSVKDGTMPLTSYILIHKNAGFQMKTKRYLLAGP